MANWWDNLVTGAQTAAGDIQTNLSNFGRDFGLGAVRAASSALRGNPLTMFPASFADNAYLTGQALRGGPVPTEGLFPGGTFASRLQESAGMAPQPQSFGGPDRFAGAQMPPVSEMPMDQYTFDQFMADMMAGMSGGGGVDLSGYNEMLADVSSREAGLGTRKAEQEAFLADLFGAGQTRLESDQKALAAAVEAALASDQARRATEIDLIRGQDASRLATANAARETLGVEGGADLSSDIAQNAVAGVGAGGSVAKRDARIRESIENQQIQSQIAGLIPMQQMATTSLGRNYEDRLSALASERAAIRAQMAQARSAASGRGGLDFSDMLNAQKVYSDLYGPGEAPEFGGILGTEQQIQQRFGNDASGILGIASRVLTSPEISKLDETSPAEVNEILRMIADADPEIRNFLNNTPGSTGAIVSYAVQALKGG